jgi:hypothetical protein
MARIKYATRTYQETAQEHADADNRCGRKWSCACGACRIARQEKFKPIPLYWVGQRLKHDKRYTVCPRCGASGVAKDAMRRPAKCEECTDQKEPRRFITSKV